MDSISKSIKGFVFLYVLSIFPVNIHGLFLWKIKKILQLLMLFKKSSEANCEPNKRHNGSEFYNRSMKSWLQDNNIEMYSTHNEGKAVFFWKIYKNLK